MYNAFNVYCRELAPGTVSLTGDRAQGVDSKHWAYSRRVHPPKKTRSSNITFVLWKSMVISTSGYNQFAKIYSTCVQHSMYMYEN